MSDTTNIWETRFQMKESIAFKCDLEQNTFRNLTPAGKVNLWNCVEMVLHTAEEQKSALFHFCF
jgi:hypothetical protein